MTRRVLLVDDDPFSQDLVGAILLSAGFETDIASDGFAGLKLLREGRYKIALIDYHLPEMDGYALAKLMLDLATSRGTELKLVGMTADRHGLAARRGSDALFGTILVKPFEPQKLIDLVERMFAETADRANPVSEAAAALLANPAVEIARKAALAFWRARKIPKLPKAYAMPNPTAEQAANLGICFDLVGRDVADVLVLMNVYGLEELLRVRHERGADFPVVVTLDKAFEPVADVFFRVNEPRSWSQLAQALISRRIASETPQKRAVAQPTND